MLKINYENRSKKNVDKKDEYCNKCTFIRMFLRAIMQCNATFTKIMLLRQPLQIRLQCNWHLWHNWKIIVFKHLQSKHLLKFKITFFPLAIRFEAIKRTVKIKSWNEMFLFLIFLCNLVHYSLEHFILISHFLINLNKSTRTLLKTSFLSFQKML